ncbi:MAG: M1 family metallopeptidase [Cuniculiplasma divulgatum]|nr:MAG: M1 family metallopeptidase [Cuniculiplasma divulgatum]
MKIEKYDIELNIDFRKLEYTGVEKITLAGEGDTFFLNSVGIDIHEISSRGKPIKFTINSKDETVNTDHKLGPTETIEVKFSARVGETLMGLYVAKYGNDHMITTQFESTGARQAFPCVDHPNYKAVFSLKLVIDNDLEAISNMPVASTEKAGDKKRVIFNDTPRMSTYLLYIGVGKFDSISRKMGHIDGYLTAPRGRLMSNDFPLVEADHVIAKYEDYFGIKYVLPKLHLISVPEFGAGAMENWGAITFRELVILVNDRTSASVKHRVSEVVAHELAHQWFGDLVTMEWWNDLWLNESFATFMSFKMVDELHKDWYMWGDFFMTETAGALNGDSLQNSHPIEAEVKTPDDIAQIFDEISYGKGASILRMIEGYAGKDNFRNGIRKYLKDHEYGNAKGSDLWESIEKASGMPVSRIMEAWIKRMGYPVVRVTRTGGKIRLEQKRFLMLGKPGKEKWPVPLTVVRDSGLESLLMESESMEIDAKGFIKLNSENTGFYRVIYDEASMESLRHSFGRLGYMDVLGLLTDSFALLKAGEINLDRYLSDLAIFMGNTHPTVAHEISGELMTLHLLMPEEEKITKTARDYLRRQADSLGRHKEGEPDSTSVLRESVTMALALVDHDYASELSALFRNFSDVESDLKSAVAISYAMVSNDFQGLLSAFKVSDSDEDRIKILMGLAFLTGQENHRKYLELAKSGEVKKQDVMRVYIYMAMNPEAREAVFQNLDDAVAIVEKYFEGTGYTGTMLESVVPFVGLGREEQMKKKLESLEKPSFAKGVKKSLETLEIYSRLVKGKGK